MFRPLLVFGMIFYSTQEELRTGGTAVEVCNTVTLRSTLKLQWFVNATIVTSMVVTVM